VHDQHQFSIMSYRSYYNAPLFARNDADSFPQSLMMDDIATLQHLYGANFETRSGDTVYSFNPNDGRMMIDGVAQNPKSGSKIFCTIWDGNGHDTYDFSNFTSDQKIDLTPGGWSTLDSTKLPNLGDGKVADGSVFNARLHNNDTRSMIEDAKGGSGADMISGNFAANALYGNAGNDSLFGMDGADKLMGGPGNDVLWGGNDGDRLFGESGADNLLGEAGSDWLDGGSENDVLYGGSDIDTLKGDTGNDRLFGDAGDDWLYGGDGADRIEGGADNDALFGQAGNDLFYFRPGSGEDYVADFTPGGTEDAIEIGYSSIDTFSELLDATTNTDDGCRISIDETTTVHPPGRFEGPAHGR
jgi:serralysin